MEKITLKTESYLIIGKENERYFPFLELEFNETVIYEDDFPKYYLIFSDDLKSAHGIGNWIMTELDKKGHDLRELIIELGKSLNLNWDIFYSDFGDLIDDSWNSETIELIKFNDNLLEKLKTTPQRRL